MVESVDPERPVLFRERLHWIFDRETTPPRAWLAT
jgi:hypothetical protein